MLVPKAQNLVNFLYDPFSRSSSVQKQYLDFMNRGSGIISAGKAWLIGRVQIPAMISLEPIFAVGWFSHKEAKRLLIVTHEHCLQMQHPSRSTVSTMSARGKVRKASAQ